MSFPETADAGEQCLTASVPAITTVPFPVLTYWQALSPETSDLAPPNTMGDVGINHIVEFTNGVFAVFNKATGTLVGARISDSAFWRTRVGLSFSGGLTDPRILFDAASQRWFASEITKSNTGKKVLLARSDTANPNGTWKGVSFTANSGFGDFDTLSLDADAVYIGTNAMDYDSLTEHLLVVNHTKLLNPNGPNATLDNKTT